MKNALQLIKATVQVYRLYRYKKNKEKYDALSRKYDNKYKMLTISYMAGFSNESEFFDRLKSIKNTVDFPSHYNADRLKELAGLNKDKFIEDIKNEVFEDTDNSSIYKRIKSFNKKDEDTNGDN